MVHKQQLPKRIKGFLPLKSIFVIFFSVIVALIVYLSNNVFTKITHEYKTSVYEEVSDKILKTYQVLLDEKINNSFLLASTMSKNNEIKRFLLNSKTSNLDLKNILEDMHTKKEYVNIRIEIISEDGISLKKSWSNTHGENLADENIQVQSLLIEQKSITTMQATKNGMFLTNIIPVYDETDVIGFFKMDMQLDDMSSKFEKEGYKSIILLNKNDSSKIIQEISYSKNFIDDIYVVNKNADSYLMKIIKQSGVDEYFLNTWTNRYKIDTSSGYLISKLELNNIDGLVIADIFIFKNSDEIEFKNIKVIQESHLATTAFIILFIAFFLYIIYAISKTKILDKENRLLIIENDELVTKTNEMDYNDKKLENLFNMQPNLMIMHNGKEITHANQRFMGFFNRFETFNGFRQKHKCVSELFKAYNAPNYIQNDKIEGIYWIDYILENPKRLYKVVIPYKDSRMEEEHHFIIKLNEMKYAGKVDERLIIVALVDITQDLVNYKNIAKDENND
ncbi:MAG: hypothetical protein WBG69_06355 [Arcobacteraceae bacterium]